MHAVSVNVSILVSAMKQLKRLCCLPLFYMVLPLSVAAQRPVDVSYSLDKKGAYVFTATNKTWCPYVVRLVFTSLENGTTDHALPFEGEVGPGPNTLFRLSKQNAAGDIVFKYSVSFRKCCLLTRPAADYPYLLPIAPGKETQAYVSETHTDTIFSRYAVRLRMKPGDTIFAARRGIVTGIDVGSTQNDAGVASTEGWNAIEIFQGDSTFAEYGIVKKDGALVKPGQTVETGTPIGLVGGDAYGRGSEARLSVCYYRENTPIFIPLQFWTKKNGKGMLKHGGTYTCEVTPAILQLEKKKKPAGPPAKKLKPHK